MMDVGWASTFLILGVILLFIFQYYTSRSVRLLSAIPSSNAPRFFGHTFDFLRLHPSEILNFMVPLFDIERGKKVLAMWTGPICLVYLRTLPDIEKLLTDNSQLRKSFNYKYLEPWLGQGLINSEGPIWQSHRKMITPTFHFKILEGFLEIMNSKLNIFSEILEKKVGTGYFDIEPFIANYSLDVITETAMSTNVDAQRTNSEFIDCMKSLTEVIIVRSVNVFYFVQPIFNLSRHKQQESKSIKYVNNYIDKILVNKRIEAKHLKKVEVSGQDIGAKQKLALLDMLLQLQCNNAKLTDKEIYDEINTFMFAGHDTVSSALSFVIYMLAVHQDVQEKVYAEVMEVLGDLEPSYQSLMNLKYLERVIKETMRLYPSVPYIGRRLKKDMPISDGYVLPKDCNAAVFIYNHHRNPENFPDPEKFDPDRFLLENIANRHPYAYIPFSAGSRNCIGQKFAMMELYATVSYLLCQFRISIEPGFVMRPISHIVLRPNVEGVRIRLDKR